MVLSYNTISILFIGFLSTRDAYLTPIIFSLHQVNELVNSVHKKKHGDTVNTSKDREKFREILVQGV